MSILLEVSETISGSLSDPSGSSALVEAVQWLRDVMLGTVATAVATLAVAASGMLMLSGRLQIKRGLSVVFGCFIIFGAASIADAIRSGGDRDSVSYVPRVMVPGPLPPRQASTAHPAAYDPYAGASVPPR
jgi:type IV secretory pathway VirB2 component (pilin)